MQGTITLDNPQLGDEVNGSFIGKSPNNHFKWIACPDCGKQRWVQNSNISSTNGRCPSCSGKVRKSIKTPESLGIDMDAPKVGDIINGRFINRNPMCLYRWAACQDCNYQRWIGKGDNYLGRCKSCVGHMSGTKANGWKGGRVEHHGYIDIKLSHEDFFFPMANSNNYVSEHRLVMARHLGRCLQAWEIVHHKNGNKSDNHIGNLYLTMKQYHKLGYGQAFQDGYEAGYKQGLIDGGKRR